MAEPPRILLHDSNTSPLAQTLSSRFPNVTIAECDSYAALPAAVADFRPDIVYTVRFAGTPGFPKEALFTPSGPKWIANGGAGTDHLGHWDKNTFTVTNAAGVAADMMAEYVIGGFLHFTLDVPGFQNDKSAREWNARTVRPLKGATLLIIGLGQTGQAIAARAKAFGMTVIGTRSTPIKMENVDEVGAPSDLHALLPRADFVSISTPLTPQTRGSIGKAEISLMKPGVVLADVSRGGIIDAAAILDGLDTGRIAAAVLDVFDEEPLPANSRFWGFENILISPHCSSAYDGSDAATFDLFLTNLDRWMRGQRLLNIVDPDKGY